MTLRQLLAELEAQTANGTALEAEILVRVGRVYREITTSYADGTFILVAGRPVQ